MINANELRIGNKIISCGIDYNHDNIFPDPEGDEIITVEIETLSNIIKSPSYYKSIPLTPDILEKAGFEYIHGLWINDYGWKIKLGANQKFYYDHGGDHLFGPIETLHQLQNLYFALTGEELEIQL